MAGRHRPVGQRALPAAGAVVLTSPVTRSEHPLDLRRLARHVPPGTATDPEGPPVLRTHEAGTLRADDVGQTVTLAGWVARRRDHGGVAFIDLRDACGVVQVVVRDEVLTGAPTAAQRVLRQGHRRGRRRARGQREPRPAHRRDRGRRRPTSRCSTRPRRCRSRSTSTSTVGEEARLKHRYLDLRRPARTRPARHPAAPQGQPAPPATCSTQHDFVEIETPTLTRSTPEGARDFLVPARLQPGQLVRPAAEPAAVQAAADGRRHGALLPDRPLLPRRGLPRRPAARVHPARHRDELRRAGRRHRARRGRGRARLGADRRTSCRRRSRG